MKKRSTIFLILVAIIIALVFSWRIGYSMRKSNDNLPALAAVSEMDEADVNSLLTGYKIAQLREVWGEPTCSKDNEDVWQIADMTLTVNYKNNGVVAICSLKDENVTPLGDRRPMLMLEGVLYLDTGKESGEVERFDGFDGEISSAVDQSMQPTENNQSNFGTGYVYQYGDPGTVEIYINGKWIVFEAENSK